MGIFTAPFRIADDMGKKAVSAYLDGDGFVRGGGDAAIDVQPDGTACVRPAGRELLLPEIHAAACAASSIIHPDCKTVMMSDWTTSTEHACAEHPLSASFVIGYAVSVGKTAEVRFVRKVGPWGGYSKDPASDARNRRRILCHDIEAKRTAEAEADASIFEGRIPSWTGLGGVIVAEDDIDCPDGKNMLRLSSRAYGGALTAAWRLGMGRIYLELASPSHCAGAGWVVADGWALPYESMAVVRAGGKGRPLWNWFAGSRPGEKKSLPFSDPSV